MDRNTCLVALAVVAAGFGFAAHATDPVARAGDPPRWYVPADTPARKYAALAKEAGAALQEALRECRTLYSDAAPRKACELGARAQWKDDMQLARSYLSGDGPSTEVAR
jgi:hypothetical protein